MAHDLFHLGIPLTEKVLRTVAVYVGLAILLRLAGKRDLAQLNTFDLVVMLLLSNVVQNAVIGNDNSLDGGLFGALVLIVANALFVRGTARNARLARVLEGTESRVVENGEYDERVLRHEGLRRAELDAALRRQGATDVSDVQEATLSTGGAVVVTLKPEAAAATKADVAALAAAIKRLEQKLAS